ncbi:hypothetical protein GCM10007385_46880 [Tateyamaria omphalii]|nr:hypothetical protein GCM10007385_46880 [Tateyamaria omphalii]
MNRFLSAGVFAEFERTRTGLECARKKGRHPGRKPKLSDDQRQEIWYGPASAQRRKLRGSSTSIALPSAV